MDNRNQGAIKTIIYSDIFDFPLTKDEIWKFLIGKKINRKTFKRELGSLVNSKARPLGSDRKLYYLLGREEIVEKRIKRKKESRKKLDFAKKIIKFISYIPTIKLIGISGALALRNSDKEDDIDLFVITSKNTLWITRLLLVFLLILMRQYRGRGKKESQKICLNMLIDEEALMFEKIRQNLYTAHEIVQLKPMFERDNIYNKFLSANKWIDTFLPNGRIMNRESGIMERRKDPLFIIHNLLLILEKFAKFFQLLYMRGHRTRETISDHMLAFHPYEYKNHVLKEYNKRLSKYEI